MSMTPGGSRAHSGHAWGHPRQRASELKVGVAGISPIGSADYGSTGASTTDSLLKFVVLAEGVSAFGTFAVTG